MKATELQIGDWVYSSFFGKTRVTSLKEHEGYGWVMTSGNENWKSDYSLSPIPLTPEILEKNANGGFGYYDNKSRATYHLHKGKEDVSIYVEWERIYPKRDSNPTLF